MKILQNLSSATVLFGALRFSVENLFICLDKQNFSA